MLPIIFSSMFQLHCIDCAVCCFRISLLFQICCIACTVLLSSKCACINRALQKGNALCEATPVVKLSTCSNAITHSPSHDDLLIFAIPNFKQSNAPAHDILFWLRFVQPLGTKLEQRILEPFVYQPVKSGSLQKPVLIVTITGAGLTQYFSNHCCAWCFNCLFVSCCCTCYQLATRHGNVTAQHCCCWIAALLTETSDRSMDRLTDWLTC